MFRQDQHRPQVRGNHKPVTSVHKVLEGPLLEYALFWMAGQLLVTRRTTNYSNNNGGGDGDGGGDDECELATTNEI